MTVGLTGTYILIKYVNIYKALKHPGNTNIWSDPGIAPELSSTVFTYATTLPLTQSI